MNNHNYFHPPPKHTQTHTQTHGGGVSSICLECAPLCLLHQPLSPYWYALAPWPLGQIDAIDWRRAGTRARSADWPTAVWQDMIVINVPLAGWLAGCEVLCITYSPPPALLPFQPPSFSFTLLFPSSYLCCSMVPVCAASADWDNSISGIPV